MARTSVDTRHADGVHVREVSQQVMGPGLLRRIPYGLSESPLAWLDRVRGESGDPGSTGSVAEETPDDVPDLVLAADLHLSTNQSAADGATLPGDPGNTAAGGN